MSRPLLSSCSYLTEDIGSIHDVRGQLQGEVLALQQTIWVTTPRDVSLCEQPQNISFWVQRTYRSVLRSDARRLVWQGIAAAR